MTEHFHCKFYTVDVSRSSCGKRHREANCGSRPGVLRPIAASCLGCSIGKAHSNGKRPAEWPDGKPVELVEIQPHGSPESMPSARTKVRPQRPTAELPSRRSPSRLVRGPDGERRTINAWGELNGLDPKVIHTRIGHGWSEADAVSVPKANRG